MPKGKKYHISLTDEEKEFLKKCIRAGKHTVRNVTRAGILLLSSEGRKDSEIVENLGICPAAVCNVRRRFSENGLHFAPDGKPFPGQPRKIDGRVQAAMTAIACSTPPGGHSSWTMRMTADKLAKPEVTESVSDETVRQYLKKVKSNRGRGNSGASAD